MLSDINPFNISGISYLHGFRITGRRGASSSETGIDVFVTEHFVGGERWHPMPAPANPNASAFRKVFCHPVAPDAHGYPVRVNNYYPVTAKRLRQRYVFEIAYADGSVYIFNLPCTSCPYELSRDRVMSSIFNLRRQNIKEDAPQKLVVVYNNICQTLRNRNDDEYIGAHTTFFQSLPKSDEESHPSYYNSLLYLFEKYGGEIKFSVQSSILDGPMVVEDGIGPITYKGSIVSREERRRLRQAAGFQDAQAKRKDKAPRSKEPPSKKQKDDASESDSCTSSDNDSDSESLNSNDTEGINFNSFQSICFKFDFVDFVV
jgi:hypothetical protein